MPDLETGSPIAEQMKTVSGGAKSYSRSRHPEEGAPSALAGRPGVVRLGAPDHQATERTAHRPAGGRDPVGEKAGWERPRRKATRC